MPRKPKKPAEPPEAAKTYDEFVEEGDTVDDETVPPDDEDEDPGATSRSRDWRDVEKLQEERRLRKLIADDLDLDLDDRRRRR